MESKDILINLRNSAGMNRREFADYFEIPYRTVQEWELGNRKMPEYLLRLMIYKLRMETERGAFQVEKPKEADCSGGRNENKSFHTEC